MNLPNAVNGNIIAIMLSVIDEKYTIFEALLSLIGTLAVRIICNPTNEKYDIYNTENIIKNKTPRLHYKI